MVWRAGQRPAGEAAPGPAANGARKLSSDRVSDQSSGASSVNSSDKFAAVVGESEGQTGRAAGKSPEGI